MILDTQSSIGGTWAEERLYPDLKTNNLLGTYEIPGFPLDASRFDVQTGQHIKGTVMHEYIRAYAYENGLVDYVRLNHKVLAAEHQDEGGWILTVAGDGQEEKPRVFARRLVMATGLFSKPWMPTFRGQESFGGRMFHAKYFPENSDTIETAKSVTILGATKFGWDTVYAYASAGVEVNWVIRGSGRPLLPSFQVSDSLTSS